MLVILLYISYPVVPVISHLSFANGLIIFTRCTSQVRFVTTLTNIPHGSLPFVHLGNVLFKGRCKHMYFQHLTYKVHFRLLSWKRKMLSQEGLLILIKHVLSIIPIYVFSALMTSKSVLIPIEKMFSKFFWGFDDAGSKGVWRSWGQRCFPILEKGLGVRRLSQVLDAFSYKVWRKWRNSMGVWASYVCGVSWQRSVMKSHLSYVDHIMRNQTVFSLAQGRFIISF